MKIRIYKFITDGGDGEYHCKIFPTENAGVEELGLIDDGGDYLDEYGYSVTVEDEILDIVDFQVV